MLYKGRFLGQLFSRVISMTGCVDKKLDVRFPVGARSKEFFFLRSIQTGFERGPPHDWLLHGGGALLTWRGEAARA
jgi:hypothetical protein